MMNSLFVIGINGAQGSGKSTLSLALQRNLQYKLNKNTVILSLDDLYKTKAERQIMAQNMHPLFVTRGVPGTHDLVLGNEILTALRHTNTASATALPRFDKGVDDRLPREKWPVVKGKVDILIFEGWCVGARPQQPAELLTPLNELEEDEDSHGIWRNYVNNALAHEYQQFFANINMLIMLKIPDFSVVYQHRWQQEQQLPRDSRMSDKEIKRFVLHYQRLTEAMFKEMPQRADMVIEVDAKRRYQYTTFSI